MLLLREVDPQEMASGFLGKNCQPQFGSEVGGHLETLGLAQMSFFSGRCELLVSGRVPESNISRIKAHLKISSPVPPQKFHNSPLKMDGLEVGRRSPFHFGSW